MSRLFAVFLAVLMAAGAARADAPKNQLRALVGQQLHLYVKDVDVDDLDQSQVAAIYTIMHSKRSTSYKLSMIRSVVGGRNSLRGLLGLN